MERGSRIITRCCASSSFSREKPIRSLSGKRGQSGRLFIRRCGGIQIGTDRRSRHVAQKAASGRFSMERVNCGLSAVSPSRRAAHTPGNKRSVPGGMETFASTIAISCALTRQPKKPRRRDRRATPVPRFPGRRPIMIPRSGSRSCQLAKHRQEANIFTEIFRCPAVWFAASS
jgi:hypothetical protein